MTPLAITFLVLSVSVLWGGLTWSILRLRKHPDLPDEEPPST